jgi:hypothetical protein
MELQLGTVLVTKLEKYVFKLLFLISVKFAINDSSVKWDASVENKTVEEYPIFIESSDELRDKFTREFHNKWIVEGEV